MTYESIIFDNRLLPDYVEKTDGLMQIRSQNTTGNMVFKHIEFHKI